MNLGRRSFVTGTAAGAGAVTIAGASTPVLARSRLTLPSGVQSGDVTADSAVLWARSSAPADWWPTYAAAGSAVACAASGRPGPAT